MHWSHQSNKLKIKVDFLEPYEFVISIACLFIPNLWMILVAELCVKGIALKKGLSLHEAFRRYSKGFSRASRYTSPLPRNECYSFVAEACKYLSIVAVVFFMQPVPAVAGFKIIDTPPPKQDKITTNEPFKNVVSGVGKGVRLESVVKMLVDTPWDAEFVSKELRALPVSWLSKSSTTSEIFAQLGRNYGIKTYFVESAGTVFIDWADGFCEGAIESEIESRKKIKSQFNFSTADLTVPKVFWISEDDRTYFC